MKMIKWPVLALIVGLGTTACEEEDLTSIFDQGSSDLAVAYIGAEGEFLDIYTRFDKAVRDSAVQAGGSVSMDGATVSRDMVANSLTIDFGNTNILTADGKARRGKIVASNLTPTFLVVPNSNVSVNTDELYVDDDKTDLYFNVYNRGLSGSANYFEIDSFALELDNGAYMMHGNKDFYWLQGFTTFMDDSDDIYRIEGASFAENPGDTVSIDATFSTASPFTVDRSCAYEVTQGIIDLNVNNKESMLTGQVDFMAEDNCNNTMRVTMNGITTVVPMPDF
jgi:hypothetical protein